MSLPGAALAALVVLAGCSSPPPAPKRDAGGRVAPAPPDAGVRGRKTTDPRLALRNLEAQIEGTSRTLAAQGGANPQIAETLVGLLLLRGQVKGRIADYEAALATAERMAASAPPADPAPFLARARARAALHLWDGALADLAEAERRGVRGEPIDDGRAAIAQARGQLDEALALRARVAEGHPTLGSLGALAVVHADRGELDQAARRFDEAERAFRDVNPFPLAWLEFQQGLMWERAGERAKAETWYRRAHERMPAHAQAAAHLAGLVAERGDAAEAIRLLEPIAAEADDPEYAAQLAALYARAGRAADAAPLLERARRDYEALVARRPEAFSDHAARFWLAQGEAKRAAALAEANLKTRRTEEAFRLALDATLAAGDADGACRHADAALAERKNPSRLLLAVAWRAYTACGAREKADQVDARLQ